MLTIADAIDRIEQTLTGERARADAAFNEGDHPRASNGQFGSGGGSSGGGKSAAQKSEKSGGFFGGLKKAFSSPPSVRLAGEDLIETSAEHARIKRALEKAAPADKPKLQAKLKDAAAKMAKAEKAHAEAMAWHEENSPKAEAKREADRKAEEDRYWASRRGPHPLDKARK